MRKSEIFEPCNCHQNKRKSLQWAEEAPEPIWGLRGNPCRAGKMAAVAGT